MSVRKWLSTAGVLAVAAVMAALLAAPASAATPHGSVTPHGCQAASATLTLETTSRGHTYDCSGTYYDAAGETAYYIFPNGWSGVLYTTDGTTEHDYYFCDRQNAGIPYYRVLRIELEQSKGWWCS